MAQQQPKVRKLNGYVYAKGTAEGFLRMQRQGIPRPVFSIENRFKNVLKKAYDKIVRKILREFMVQVHTAGIKVKSGELTTDAEGDDLQLLMSFFEDMRRQEEEARNAEKAAQLKSSLMSAATNLESSWDTENPVPIGEDFENEVAKILLQNQQDYTKRLSSDASGKMADILRSFSIDKRELYNENMDNLRTLYLNNTVERIGWEENWLKKQLLEKINDYVTGKSDTLDIEEVTKGLLHDSARMAQFFARDQLSRLNKATTLSTFVNAGVTKVKWVTTHDVRVRASHKALDGQVFDIRNLPDEIDDYNCRCGLVPVEWAE